MSICRDCRFLDIRSTTAEGHSGIYQTKRSSWRCLVFEDTESSIDSVTGEEIKPIKPWCYIKNGMGRCKDFEPRSTD